jgi:hypothetical protein
MKIYKTVILPVVLYGCENWSLALCEEHRLRVFENRVQRRVFGPKMDEIMGWRNFCNEETHDLYSSPNIITMIKLRRRRACSTHCRERRNACKILVGKPERKRPVRRPRHRWEDNIKMDLGETGWGGMVWINLTQDRDQWRALVNTVLNFRVP